MISIITAHYNSSKKIERLIKSLKQQTNNDFEWIIVDDCSCDNEFDLMKRKVEESGLNTSVLSNEINGGPGVTRNNGIKHSKGDYLTFVDCDDAVAEDFVSTLALLIMEKNTDIIAFDYVRIQGSHKDRCDKIDRVSEGMIDVDTFLRQAKTCVCGGAFKRDLIQANGIIFPKLYRYEDWVFNVYAALKATTIWYEKKELYFYIETENSLVTAGVYDAGEYAIKAFEIIESLLREHSEEILMLLYAREILYVNAISKAKKKNFAEYKVYMKALFLQGEYKLDKTNICKLAMHHKLVLYMISLKMYRVLWLVAKLT